MSGLLDELAQPQCKSTASVDPRSKRFSALEGLRNEVRSRWPEWITLALYSVIVAIAIPRHEPWTDEAQSWQLARSLSLHRLFQQYIRYEGSPGLWHFILWTLNRAHVSYAGMHWICGAIAIAAASIFVLRSPFPRYLKLSLPFTYFLLFQYAVIARSYVLVPVILFLIACWWKRGPVRVAFLLGLLANVALHAAVISGGLAVVYTIEWVRTMHAAEPRSRRDLIVAAVILLSFYSFAIWTAWPPHDLVIARVRGQSRPFALVAIASLVWGVCQPWILSIPFWIAISICLHARRSLFYLLPVLLFACFSGAIYVNWWHMGLLIPLVLSLLWITWPPPGHIVRRQETICRGALILMAGVQILWSVYALHYDLYRDYSPDLAASKFLKPFVRNNDTIAVTYLDDPWIQAFQTVGILPYFDHNIYMNQPDSFWWWSNKNRTEQSFPAALRSHPRIVMVEINQLHPDTRINLEVPKVRLLINAGYRLTNVFCGAKPERFDLVENSCHLMFQDFDHLENQGAGSVQK